MGATGRRQSEAVGPFLAETKVRYREKCCTATESVATPAYVRPRNHLLAALPPGEWKRWLPQLEPVDLPLGQVIYESGGSLSHVYFPTTAIVSLLYVMENGASAEIAVVGNEGLVGIALFMAASPRPTGQ